MKYNVTCECYSNSNDFDYGRFNYVGDYIEAENLEQAIDIALECITDAIRNNHEACITGTATDALDALGLEFDDLTGEQQAIVKSELKKQILKDMVYQK